MDNTVLCLGKFRDVSKQPVAPISRKEESRRGTLMAGV
jgi:hypothetical protein